MRELFERKDNSLENVDQLCDKWVDSCNEIKSYYQRWWNLSEELQKCVVSVAHRRPASKKASSKSTSWLESSAHHQQ